MPYILACRSLASWDADIKKDVFSNGLLGWLSSIPGSGRSPGEGDGSPLQYSCLGKRMDRAAWRATVHGVTEESDMT